MAFKGINSQIQEKLMYYNIDGRTNGTHKKYKCELCYQRFRLKASLLTHRCINTKIRRI